MLIFSIFLLQFCNFLVITHFVQGLQGIPGSPFILDNPEVKCKDEKGKSVDWFVAYKLPTIIESKNELFKNGMGYVYIKPGMSDWTTSSRRINESESILGITTRPLFQENASSSLAYVLYNDQPPGETPVVYNGHTKGLILANKDGGLWLSFSLPHFPALSNKTRNFFSYPTGGLVNGQHFICMSLSLGQIDEIGLILNYTFPNVYNFSIPGELKGSLGKLNEFLEKKTKAKGPPWFKFINFQIGQENQNPANFSIYVKSPKFRKDVYSSWISQNLKTSLEVQSWQNGAHKLVPDCSNNYTTSNIQHKKIAGEIFPSTIDHSKWAVGDSREYWTCLSDLNRMRPQKTRGGVSICFKNKSVWTGFNGTIIDVEPCPKTKTKTKPKPK